MRNWKKWIIRDLCTDIIDCVNKTAPISDNPTSFRMLRTSDIRNGFINLENLNCVTEEIFHKWSRRGYLQKGDVIFTREAPLGEVGLVRESKNYFLGQRLVLYRSNPKVCDNRFLLYWFLNPQNKENIKSCGVGATVTHMRVPNCEKIEVYAPDLAIQTKIADILSTYDDLIENNRKQIKLLEEAAQRLYKEWFVDLRFPGHENTPIVNRIPMRWRVSDADSHITFSSGFAFKSTDFSDDGQYKIVTIKNVKNGQFIAQNASNIAEIPEKMPRHCRLVDGDILLSLTGNVGRVCLVYGVNYLLNQRVVKLQSSHPAFTYCLFRSKNMFDAMNNLANGAAQQNLSPIRTGKIKVLFPCMDIIQKFEKLVVPMLQKIVVLNKEVLIADSIRASLLPKLMNGEIEV